MEQEKSNTNSPKESNVSKKYSKTSVLSKTISKTSLIHKVGFHFGLSSASKWNLKTFYRRQDLLKNPVGYLENLIVILGS